MKNGVVLIGPEKSGKSTVGKLLSMSLGLPFNDLSNDIERFRKGKDVDRQTLFDIFQAEGYGAVIRHLMPQRASIVERALLAYGPSVIELGAFYTVFDDEKLLQHVQQSLRTYDAVVFLLPSADVEQSVHVLEKRAQVIYRGVDWNEYFVRHPANRRLAKHCIYTKGQTPKQTCMEIMDRLDRDSKSIFLLGPVGTGKTTIAKLLSERLQRSQAGMDGIRRRYYQEAGYSEDEESKINKTKGFPGVLDYWKRFDLHAIKRALEDHPDCIVDFGAGQTVFDSEPDLAQVEKLLEPYPNIFLLLPSPDPDESIVVLHDRLRQRTSVDGVPLIRYLMTHHSNKQLATFRVYTEGKTPTETCKEILENLPVD